MSLAKRLVPDVVRSQSLKVKTGEIIVGAALLILSTMTRPDISSILPDDLVLWGVLVILGIIVELLLVLTVSEEISEIENEIEQERRNIHEAADEIDQTQTDIQDTKKEIESTKDDIFSFMSDSQGGGARKSIEDRVSELEEVIGTGRGATTGGIERRVSELERELEGMSRGPF